MDLFKRYGTDEELVEEGVVYQFGEAIIKLKYLGRENKEYFSAMRAYSEEINRKNLISKNGKIKSDFGTQEMLREKMCNIFAETVFVSWEGFVFKGEPIDNTKTAFKEVILNYPSFLDELTELATTESNYQDEQDLKN